ncbi:hypothetical protein ACHELK_004435 [Vibrio vulnificus]|uniref:hypothetical protein n=1 Tax=Vibrio vulnificus TaxID=672 RepID=UPI00092C69B9|nr:hypothetical protein [Vibrio vulnificus]EJV9416054.1 hypothetical protein [Vibrio vulnificus]OJI37219.1 hypothetical protein VVDAL7940_02123 [Vibrio vulnificus]
MNVDNLVSYYQSFEKDIEKLSRYIEICDDNCAVYSVELTRLYLAICSEVDVALKELCYIVSDESPQSMKGYIKVIREHCPSIIKHRVVFTGHDISRYPWKELEDSQNMSWWTQHNKVKHHRMEHYKDANLGNVLLAFSALYTINVQIMFELKCKESITWRYEFGNFLSQTKHLFNLVRLPDVPFAYFLLE